MLNKTVSLIVTITGFIFLLSSCKTYYISVDSFKQQFAAVDTLKLKQVTTMGPGGDKVKYETNPIEIIKCVDSKGNAAELKNSPSIEIRFTYNNNNKRTVFYFDLISVNDSSITGIQSRFIPSIRKMISINSIKKIEVQDGKKKFRYVDR